MPEPHSRADVQQPGRGSQLGGHRVQPEDLGRAEHQGRIAHRVGRRQQGQPLRPGRQPGQPVHVLVLDAPGQIPGVRQREPAGQFGGGQPPAQFDQGQRVAVGLLDDPVPDVLVERSVRGAGQQAAGRLVVQPAQREFGQPGQVIRCGGRRPGREDQRDRLGQQTAPDESEHLCRGLIEPLDVVHHAQHRLFLGCLGQQAERGQRDQEPVRAVANVQPERDAEPAPLRLRQCAEPAEQRATQLVQAREGQFHLRFDAGAPDHPESRCLANQVPQQSRFAYPRRAAQHQHRALATVHAGDQLIQDFQLAGPADQPG